MNYIVVIINPLMEAVVVVHEKVLQSRVETKKEAEFGSLSFGTDI